MSQRINYLVLDSKDRTNHSESTTDCSFHIQPTISGCHQAKLVSLVCPNTQYNINSTNNHIYFNDGSDKVGVITPGNYDITSFLIVVKSTMESVSSLTFTVAYDDTTMKITIIGSANWNFTFFNRVNSSVSILGFDEIDYPVGLSVTGDYVIDLSLPLYFYILVDEFGTNVKSGNPFDNGSFVITNNTNVSDIITFTENTFFRQVFNITESNMQTVHVNFRDHNNRVMDLNGSDWVMIFRLHYV